MGTLWPDLRQSARALLKARGFSLTVILTLAVGIGANTSIFTVINAVLLRPLPYPDADRLVEVMEVQKGVDPFGASGSFADFHDLQRAKSLELASAAWASHNLEGEGFAERLSALLATGNLFNVLGTKPLLGRTFDAGDDRRDAPAVALISHPLWLRRYGGDPTIIGRTIRLSGNPTTVIGVMPPGFHYPYPDVEVWQPFANAFEPEVLTSRGSRFFFAIGRLRPQATQRQARIELDTIAAGLEASDPKTNAGWTVRVVSSLELTTKSVRLPLLLLGGGVLLVVLIACVNLGSLFLARGLERRREWAVRAALGASSRRLVLQGLGESVLLSLCGGALGLWLSQVGLSLLVALAPPGIPRLDELSIDGRVLAFTSAAVIGTGLLFGLFTALARPPGDSLHEWLQSGSVATTEARGLRRLRESLLVGQVALALMLLLGGALLAVSFRRLVTLDLGFRPDRLLALHVSLAVPKYKALADQKRYAREALQVLAETPGVEAAAITSKVPLDSHGSTIPVPFAIEGSAVEPAQAAKAGYRAASEDYFRLAGISMVEGRGFTSADINESPHVIAVNQTFARLHFPGGALGKRLRWLDEPLDSGWHTIVAILGDVHSQVVDQEERPVVYEPTFQRGFDWMSWLTLVVRTRGEPSAMIERSNAHYQRWIRRSPSSTPISLSQLVHQSMAERRFALALALSLAAIALLLMLTSIYGVISSWVGQRTHEIGIRRALGAQRAHVMRLVFGRGVALTLAGVGLGLLGAFGLTRLMAALVYGVSTTDPTTFAGCAALEIARPRSGPAGFRRGARPASTRWWRCADLDWSGCDLQGRSRNTGQYGAQIPHLFELNNRTRPSRQSLVARSQTGRAGENPTPKMEGRMP